ncbi:ATP-binding protein [Flavobacterium sp. MFBS3-15]|uniref:tetratricopeptide repeat-containing sensor histidine kinase n=1 Tax=Flavobacterium sp. MFBS3-15 TaxID=2989816 RepID=UPI002236779A|nr:tetratricopeptide repeat protein [Flavobacterium sp. MFBS3-15]MCW4467951.1 ATP-binding protein [Flavobacterium sp. MFBS3-15]
MKRQVYKTAILFFFFLCSGIAFAQDKEKADSLKAVLAKGGSLTAVEKMEVLAQISTYAASPEEVLKYADKLLALASAQKAYPYMVTAYHYKGVAHRLKGDLKVSLKNLFASAALAANHKLYTEEAEAYGEIANTYTANKDNKNALVYNKKAVTIMRRQDNKERLAVNLLNTGYNYYILNQMDSALVCYNEAEPIFESIGLTIGSAYTIGNRALVYWKHGKTGVAEKDLLKAIAMLKTLGDQFGMADYHNQLGRLYFEQGQPEKAAGHTLQAEKMAKGLNLKGQVRDANKLLSGIYEEKGDYQKSLAYYKQFVAYRDSIENTENTKEIANLRTEFEVNQKQKEIAVLEKNQLMSRIYIIIAVSLLLIAILLLLYFRQRFVNTRLLAGNERKLHDEKIKNLLKMQETKALQSMVEGQEKERKHIARELHNHFGSLLATIKVNLNAIDEKAISNHATLTTLVDQACSDIRNLSHTLNMGVSEDFGLIPAIKELVANIEQSNKLEVELSASVGDEEMGVEMELFIYRVIQELVSNVLKHSKATKLSITIICFDEDNLINIIIEDNGKGFDVAQKMKAGSGMGLNTLAEMITERHGDIKIDSNATSGTTVIIDLPIDAEGYNQ